MFGKTNPERMEFLMRQLRGKIRAEKQARQTQYINHIALARQVLDEAGIHDPIGTRAAYDRALREQIATELEAGNV